MSVTTTKLTYEDYLDLPDDGLRHEIIDGEHFVTPAPNDRHQMISQNLEDAIRAYRRTHPEVLHRHAPYEVKLSDVDVVQPDILVITPARRHVRRGRGVTGAPDLVIEILSESNRRYDEVTKRKLYEQFGVVEYWVVDPDIDSVRIYRRDGEVLKRVAETSLEEGGTLTTPLLPDFELPISEVFAEQ